MSGSAPMTNAEAAQLIARTLGPVLPCCHPDGERCGCSGRYDRDLARLVPHEGHDIAKAPISKLAPNGVDNATTNSAKIDLWWRREPDAGIGLALKPARVLFIDPDSPEALAEAEALGLDGGMRRDSRNVGFFFRRPDDCPVINITKSADHTDLEIRTDGYAVAWNTHQSGVPVRVDLGQPLQDAPRWAVERLKHKGAQKAAQDATRAARKSERAERGIVGDEPLWQLDDLALARWNGTLFEVDSLGNLDRSRSLYHLGLELARHGATEAGIRWAVENRDAALGWDKYTGRSDADTRYSEIAEKAVAAGAGPTVTSAHWFSPNGPAGGDGAETCRGCAERDHTIEQLREEAAAYSAENQLLTAGPVPAQEAAFWRHLVGRAALAVTKGDERVKLYLPTDSGHANVSPASASRALNKLRTAETATLPFTVEDTWRGGKQHVAIVVPSTINGEPWSQRRACLALARATLDKERATVGGSRAAIDARWRCRHHPDGAVVETTTKHYRCAEDDCAESWSPSPSVVRRGGKKDGIQIESRPGKSIELYGAAFATTVTSDGIQFECRGDGRQIDAVTSLEEPRQIDARQGGTTAVSFVSRDDLEGADEPHYRALDQEDDPSEDDGIQFECGGDAPPVLYWPAGAKLADVLRMAGAHDPGDAPSEPPSPPKPLPIAPSSHVSRYRYRPPPAIAGAEVDE